MTEPAKDVDPRIAWGLIVVVLLIWSHTWAYLEGRSRESELTLDAYQAALDAQAITKAYQVQASRLFHVSERAVRVCLTEDARMHEDLQAVGWEIE